LPPQRVGITKAFALEINGVNFPAAKPQIPVVAGDTPKDLIFENGKGGVIKLKRGENTVGIEPCLVARIDPGQI
jgi:hypothetical protein